VGTTNALQRDYNSLLDVYKKAASSDELEKEITSKYPKVNQLYKARPLPPKNTKIRIDPRVFFTLEDSELKKIVNKMNVNKKPDDEKVLSCLRWVRKHIRYLQDDKNFGSAEYWSFPFETLSKKKGDCDSQTILLTNLCLIAGIPYFKLRITVGPVKGGYHAFLTYYVESADKWVIIDSTYYPNYKKPADRLDYKDEKNYFEEIWFSFDKKYIYQKGHKNWKL